MTARIPVVVLAGYLGSGKTTLLNHLLSNNDGRRIGVLVNDFGSINIDAMNVAGQVDVAMSLENGCLCCAVDSDGVDRMLERLAHPGAPLDAIVIEASGIAEPRQLVRLVLSSQNPNIEFGGLVEVVDAAEFDDTRARHPELDDHVRLADLVVVNKVDRVGEADREGVITSVREIADGAVLAVERGRISPGILFEAPEVRESAGARQLSFADLEEHDDDHDQHMHAAYESVEFTAEEPLNPSAFLRFLNERSRGVYRIKGPIDFGPSGDEKRFMLHAVGVYAAFEKTRWKGERATNLVLIGTDLDGEALTARLKSCVDPDPNTIDQMGMLNLARHLDT
ncbi:CobW family GTP-binding protein [Saccharopolyspora mangrovi]|uniref:GTP-binding protein n=1 Tax=Saccharopolyspora mangrovi TaxID=3082379 RepID=A0ABU6ACJ7_9PSEU|nr:CobW family GTP-binding protein [Saccharopolyspora sp. S2-29]MEB3369229.1 GTP-binding protein [Saccharopolyspora sp. S2-29]